MNRLRDKIRRIQQQRGLFAVEFAIVSVVFLIVLLMVMEFGRLLFVWNVVDEITRRGARLAAVCPVTVSPDIGTPGIFGRSTMVGNSLNIAVGEFVIEYLDNGGSPVFDPVNNLDDIDFVRASIVGYQLQTFFPIEVLFNVPAFETTLPAESLGNSPDGTGVTTC